MIHWKLKNLMVTFWKEACNLLDLDYEDPKEVNPYVLPT
jgi:hypothetical protein